MLKKSIEELEIGILKRCERVEGRLTAAAGGATLLGDRNPVGLVV